MEPEISSDDMELSDSDSGFIDNIRGDGIYDTDTDSDLDASDIDAAEENVVATVLQSAEEMTHSSHDTDRCRMAPHLHWMHCCVHCIALYHIQCE